MITLKTILNAFIVSSLTINFAAIGMDSRKQYAPKNENELSDIQKQIAEFNTRISNIKKSANILQEISNQDLSIKRLSFVRKAADEIIQRPFNYTHPPTIIVELTDEPKIGYLDTKGIENLRRTALSAKESDPFVTITNNIAPNFLDTINQQVSNEKKELHAILNKLNMNSKTEKEERIKQITRFSYRLCKMKISVQKILDSKLPPIIPIKYLEDGNSINIIEDTSAFLQFKDGKKLNTLMATFKQQPTILFCHLTPESAEKLRTTNTDQLKSSDIIAIIKEIDAKKNEFRNKEIVERFPLGEIGENQKYSFNPLPNSNVVKHYCNYHKHGNNGYSEEKRNHEIIMSLNSNAVTFFKNRELNYKKHKFNPSKDKNEDENASII